MDHHRDWPGLPKHILELILGKVETYIDFSRFSSVCVSWHSLAFKNKYTKQNKMLSHHYLPMLLVPSEEEEDRWSVYNVIDTHDRTYNNNLKLKSSLLYGKCFSGSSLGWLVVVNEDYTITLYKPYYFISSSSSNPKTTTHVNLPCLLPRPLSDYDDILEEDFDDVNIYDDNPEEFYYQGSEYHVSKVLITASPLTNNKNNIIPNDECIVVVIYGHMCELACIRYGKDTTWTKIIDEKFSKGFEDVAHYKGKFYGLTFDGTLVSFQYPNLNTGITTYMKFVAPNIRSLEGISRKYLVMAMNALPKILEFLKLDLDVDGDGGGKWLEKKSLGDIALFVGDNSSIAVLASKFNIQPNCIYFTHHHTGLATKIARNCDLGVYNLENQTFKFNYNLPSTIFHMICKRHPIWIEPPISSTNFN
ncbi:hypothetical protein G4B88_015951 [Cannabis sativa]|uniref:F-box domain-containing protein n=1 Tax=Cannabis sativa TaxID=3483 RepID=A0A7J6ETQ1_CANSA|nr:hypothetical protein G4B88_015951 [Cannabis sativa]